MFTKVRITNLVIALVMLIGVVFPAGIAMAQDAPGPKFFLPLVNRRAAANLDQIALQTVAARYGVAVTDLVVEASAKAEYQYAGQATYAYKIYNNASGEAYGIELSQAGQEVSTEAMLAADAQAYTAQYGKVEPALADFLALAGPDQAVPVIIALNGVEDAAFARPEAGVELSEAEYNAFKAQANAAQADAVAAVTGPFVSAADSMGIKVTATELLPYAFGSMRAADVNMLAQMPEVRSIGLDLMAESQLNWIWSRHNVQSVYNRRQIGRGVKVGVNEVGHGIDPGNPYLRFLYVDPITRCAGKAGHETGVLGEIYSSHPSYSGVAMGTQAGTFGSCAGSFAELSSAATRARNWGADVVTNSWGAINPTRLLSRTIEGFYDDMVRNTATSVVFAAGNKGTSTGLITNPSGAYNILTVGAEDKNSLANPNIASYSSYIDPDTRIDDMEKPEVTATGSSVISTLTASPWVGGIGSGTSFAAPVVAGEAADIIPRNFSLAGWPEPVKAIIIASAVKPVNTVKDRKGAGGVDFLAADNVALRGSIGTYSYGGYTCATVTPYTMTTQAITVGKKVRFAVAWDTYSAFASYTTRPSADLDLRVYRLDTGAQVASSISFDNTYEWVEFTAPVSTNYAFRLIRHDCLGSPGYFGWAFYRY